MRYEFLKGAPRFAVMAVLAAAWFTPAVFGITKSKHIPNPPKGYVLAWSDNFNNGRINTKKWYYRTDRKYLSVQLPQNVSVQHGILKIAVKHQRIDHKQYSGGGLISRRRFKYGYYEAGLRIPVGSGWHTSFWLEKYNPMIRTTEGFKHAPAYQEIDICEAACWNTDPVAFAQGTGSGMPVVRGGPSRVLAAPADAVSMSLHTHGKQLLYANGKLAVLHGVSMAAKPGTPNWLHIRKSLVAAVDNWHSRLIRLPLSQDAWFGKLPNSRHGGAAYRHTVDALVQYCAAHHAYIDLTLQWTDMGRWGKYIGRHRMPDGNSVRFWRAVAGRYKNDPNVLLGLFATPNGVDWHTWLYGGVCTEESATRVIAYRAAGMQELYNTVRAAGAKNIVVVPGCRNGYDLFGVIHGFAVRGSNIIYSTSIYAWVSSHVSISHWARQWRSHFELPAAQVPVLVAQWGGGRKGAAYKHLLLRAMKKRNMSWTAVNFGVGPPWPALINNWQYQPSKLGELVKSQLTAAVSGAEGGK